jgi:hypothetical protein
VRQREDLRGEGGEGEEEGWEEGGREDRVPYTENFYVYAPWGDALVPPRPRGRGRVGREREGEERVWIGK